MKKRDYFQIWQNKLKNLQNMTKYHRLSTMDRDRLLSAS